LSRSCDSKGIFKRLYAADLPLRSQQHPEDGY